MVIAPTFNSQEGSIDTQTIRPSGFVSPGHSGPGRPQAPVAFLGSCSSPKKVCHQGQACQRHIICPLSQKCLLSTCSVQGTVQRWEILLSIYWGFYHLTIAYRFMYWFKSINYWFLCSVLKTSSSLMLFLTVFQRGLRAFTTTAFKQVDSRRS